MKFEIRRFAAAGAGAGEFEQRLLDLLRTDGADFDFAAVEFGKVEEEIPVVALGEAERRLRLHVDGSEARFLLVLDGANIDADGAAGAVFGRDLNGVLQAGEFLVAWRRRT